MLHSDSAIKVLLLSCVERKPQVELSACPLHNGGKVGSSLHKGLGSPHHQSCPEAGGGILIYALTRVQLCCSCNIEWRGSVTQPSNWLLTLYVNVALGPACLVSPEVSNSESPTRFSVLQVRYHLTAAGLLAQLKIHKTPVCTGCIFGSCTKMQSCLAGYQVFGCRCISLSTCSDCL